MNLLLSSAKLFFAFLLIGTVTTGCVSQEQTDSVAGSGPSTTGTAVTVIAAATPTPIPVHPLLITATSGFTFGVIAVGASVSVPITIINAGSDLASNGQLVITPSSGLATAITFSSDTCSAQVLTPGQSCTLNVNFTPASATSFAGVITLSYTGASAGTNYSLPVAYNGSSTLPQPILAAAPSSWDFGTISTSSTSAKTLTVSNSSAGAAILQSATITGSGYSITTDNCNTVTLTTLNTCTIALQFAPLIPGSSLGVLTLNYQNAAGSSLTKQISLSGIGNVPQPVLVLSANPVPFGDTATNATTPAFATVSNSTSVSATLGTPTVTGAGISIFSTDCPATLGANLTCKINLRFTPTVIGTVAGTLTLPYSSAQGISYTATDGLTGNGITPHVSFSFSGFTGVVGTDTTNLTGTGVTLQWTAQGSASYYKVTQTGGSTGTVISAHLAPTSVSTYNVTGLTPNTTYQFKVNAFDATDTSDGNTSFVSVTTPNVTGSTFGGWSDVVANGSVFTDIGTVDTRMGTTGTSRLDRNLAMIYGFDNTAITTVNNQITVSAAIATGTGLTYATDGTAPTGLTNGSIYYAINISATQIELASTYANALAGTAIAISTVGTGNMTLMPTGIVKLGWDLFTFTPTAVATGYNIYRSTASTGPFTLIGSSTTQSFSDTQVSDSTTYYYQVQPVLTGTEVDAATVTDSVIKVFVPAQNMSLIHRWIANREACTNLLGFTYPAGVNRNDNYSCAYTWGAGYAPHTTYDKTKWDIGYSIVMDRWQNGCKMKTYGVPGPVNGNGSVGDVYLNTPASSNQSFCYIKDTATTWIQESAGLTAAQRAIIRTNYPGYMPTAISQSPAYATCHGRSPSGVTDGNTNSSLRLMRLYEANLARAIQGNNVNNRGATTLANIMGGINLPTNGSCNNNGNNGVNLADPSLFAHTNNVMINGSALTRNCYTRYEIFNLWDMAYEWTGSQYYAPNAGGGYFTASNIDAGDNLLEGFLTNGVMGPANVYQANQTGIIFNPSSITAPVLPLFGVQAVGPASPTLGSRVVNYSNFDFAARTQLNEPVAYGTNSAGVVLGSGWNSTTNVRDRFSFSINETNTPAGYNNQSMFTNRCVGEVP